MSHDWSRVRAVFERAVDLPPAERSAFLDEQAGHDTPLRAEVERLLAASQAPGDFLRPPGGETLAAHAAATAPAPERLGPFRIVRELARGGMGTVYVAEQEHPARTVAVKVLHGSLAVPRARARFEAEVAALARLQHPGIAQVFEAGVEPCGTAWFAMELLAEALPITQFAAARDLSLAARLEAFLHVCAAVQHAHQRGVIHRDLKPANILALPDGTAKVIDFGIARVLDPERPAQTLAGELLGTLACMSPEQVEGLPTDARTDVYGLGVVLHELVAGRQPFGFDGLSLPAACRVIVENDPAPVSAHVRGLPRELDWIVARALRKAPAARYASVADLADDVQRCLAHQPVRAGPDTTAYRLRKFARRHRVGVAAAAAVVAVSIAAFVMVTLALLRTQRAEAAERTGRTTAEAAAARASAALDFLLDVFSSVDPGKDGRDIKMADALARAARDFGARFAHEPTIQAALGEAIGMAYFGLGMLPEAEQHLQKCVAVHEQCHGPRSRETAQALGALCYVQLRAGKLAETEATLLRAEAIGKDLGDELVTLATGTRAADMLRAKGDKQRAAAALQPIVARLRELRGTGNRETLMAVNLLAGVLHELGDVDAAEPLYREAAEGLAALKGEDHPDALGAMTNHAMVLHSRGRRADLVPVLERLVAVRRRVLGPDHPDTIGTINNLGGVHFGLRQFEDAARWFGEALALLGPKVGETSPVYLTLLANLATTERERGNFPRAIELGDRALALRQKALGENHETTLTTMSMVADVRRQAGDLEAALALFGDCRDRAAAEEPPQLANVYRCELGMSRCNAALHHFEDAERLLQHLAETFAASEKAAQVKGQLSQPDADFVVLYEAWGRPDEAAPYRKRLAERAGKR